MKKGMKIINIVKKYLEDGGVPDVDIIVEHIRLTDPKRFRSVPLAGLRIPVKKLLKDEGYLNIPVKREYPEPTQISNKIDFSNIGGVSSIMKDIQELLIFPLEHPEVFKELKLEPARGILFCGSPGTGKTYLANAICENIGLPFFKLAATEIVSGMSGESEQKLRDVFDKALSSAPSLLFIDEIDAITPKRSNSQREMEKRIVSQLLSCMDNLGGFLKHGKLVIVLAATNRLESIDPALRRAGRFDREIHFGIPSQEQRLEIIKVLVKDLKIKGEVDLKFLAKSTPGYVGADLYSLVKETGNQAISRIMKEKSFEISSFFIEINDFLNALKIVQPSSKREGFSTIPDTTWEDIGGLEALREELYYTIVHAINNPEKYAALGIAAAAGILLCGPPGCGKTLLAKAVANESQANFIAVNGPELLNKYVGESEKAVRQLFQRARDSAPCIIFFDEIDSLCASRGSESQATERVVNQLLTELNGLQDRKQVYVIAATNRPDIIDPAILRPGRLDKMLYVLLPELSDRMSILKALLKKTPVMGVDIESIAGKTNGYSGADLAMVVREAASQVLRNNNSDNVVTQKEFEFALKKIRPSVSNEQNLFFEKMKNKIAN